MAILDLLRASEASILRDACAAVERAHLGGYQRNGPAATEERLRTLFDLIVRCIETHDATDAITHAERIARERFEAGIDLAEVQTTINVLEEAIWQRVLREVPASEQARALGLVSTILGITKDTLGRSYVSLASSAHAPSLNLRALFGGTEGDSGAGATPVQ